jgi:hypothetical protein
MMPRQDGGVVDNRLRVHGISGLRVVDASIFPVITDGHPQVSRYLTGFAYAPSAEPLSITCISGRGLHGGGKSRRHDQGGSQPRLNLGTRSHLCGVM